MGRGATREAAGEALAQRRSNRDRRSSSARRSGAPPPPPRRSTISHAELLARLAVEQLVYEAASLVPGLVPPRERVDAESSHAQRDKDGVEIDQGIFVSAMLASPDAGRHLCHAMLLPRPEALERLPELEKKGRIDLGAAEVFRRAKLRT
jgi:thioesterase DpgC